MAHRRQRATLPLPSGLIDTHTHTHTHTHTFIYFPSLSPATKNPREVSCGFSSNIQYWWSSVASNYNLVLGFIRFNTQMALYITVQETGVTGTYNVYRGSQSDGFYAWSPKGLSFQPRPLLSCGTSEHACSLLPTAQLSSSSQYIGTSGAGWPITVTIHSMKGDSCTMAPITGIGSFIYSQVRLHFPPLFVHLHAAFAHADLAGAQPGGTALVDSGCQFANPPANFNHAESVCNQCPIPLLNNGQQ